MRRTLVENDIAACLRILNQDPLRHPLQLVNDGACQHAMRDSASACVSTAGVNPWPSTGVAPAFAEAEDVSAMSAPVIPSAPLNPACE